MDLEFLSCSYVVPMYKSCLTDFVPFVDLVMESIDQRNGGKHLVSRL